MNETSCHFHLNIYFNCHRGQKFFSLMRNNGSAPPFQGWFSATIRCTSIMWIANLNPLRIVRIKWVCRVWRRLLKLFDISHPPVLWTLNKQIHTKINWWIWILTQHTQKRYARASTKQINGQTPKLSIKCIRPPWNVPFIYRKFGMCQWNLAIFKKYWTKSNGLVYGQPVLRIYLRCDFPSPSN